MPVITTAQLIEVIERLHLLSANQLGELRRASADREAKALARELIERGWLTPYQANQLLQGKGDELLLGSYVLLERLGEGGMGTVFRARNWKLDRTCALKLIRRERLAKPDAVKRFYREIQSAAKLDHPNVVRAHDADQVGGTHFFAMEYVDGIDLAKLVREHGPLPPGLACEYIRQAAVGLQHAHERGLVHRDIKPANLLLARARGAGTVKLLDLGLARQDETMASEHSATLTQVGMLMGTPDFMAPEQSVSSHTVDIRADLYSLGCTLYFLLTGSVPFPGGSLTEKLVKHQMEQPKPLEMLRPDVPAAVADLVYKLIAKKPEERVQTPGELADELQKLLSTPRIWQAAPAAKARQVAATIEKSNPPTDSLWASIVAEVAEETVEHKRAVNPKVWYMAAGAACLVLLVIGLAAVVFRPSAVPPPNMVKPADRKHTITPSAIVHSTPSRRPLAVAPFNATQAKEQQQRWADHLKQPVDVINSIGMKLALIPPGEFLMGAGAEEMKLILEGVEENKIESVRNEYKQHRVRITRPFYLGVLEVSQQEWFRVMPGEANNLDRPAEFVSWEEADEFCRKLSELPEERRAGRRYRLPTEAEWEYACRAGTATAFAFGDELTPNQAAIQPGSGAKRAASFAPNAWGLFDMHGKLWEWCADWCDPTYYERSIANDPPGPAKIDARHVARGGSAAHGSRRAMSASRSGYSVKLQDFGCRVVCEIDEGWIDLLAGIDLAAQANEGHRGTGGDIGGKWEQTNEGIRSPGREWSRVKLPVWFDRDYRIEVRFTPRRSRWANVLHLLLPVAGKSVDIFGGNPSRSLLRSDARTDDWRETPVPLTRELAPALAADQTSTVDVSVSAQGEEVSIEVRFDGKLLTTWTGAPDVLAPRAWAQSTRDQLWLMPWATIMDIHSVRVRRLPASEVSTATFTAPNIENGLKPVGSGGREFKVVEVAGKSAIQFVDPQAKDLHFALDDAIAFDLPADNADRFIVRATVFDERPGSYSLGYDSHRPSGGGVSHVVPYRHLTGSGKWVEMEWELPYPKLANRMAGGGDFALVVYSRPVHQVTFQRMRAKPGTDTVTGTFTAPNIENGLKPVGTGGFAFQVEEVKGKPVLRCVTERPIHFQLDDAIAHDLPADSTDRIIVRATILDEKPSNINLGYDTHKPVTEVSRTALPLHALKGSGEWVDLEWDLPDAKLANRLFFQADFGIGAASYPIAIHRVVLERIRTENPPGAQVLPPALLHEVHTHAWFNAVAVTPDGNTIAAMNRDSNLYIFDVKGEQKLRKNVANDNGYGMALALDGQRVATSGGDGLKLWTFPELNALGSSQLEKTFAHSLAFSPDGQTLLMGCQDGRVLRWDAKGDSKPQELGRLANHIQQVAMSPDAKHWAATSFVAGLLLDGGRLDAPVATGARGFVAFSPNSELLAAGTGDKAIVLWDTASRQKKATLTGHEAPTNAGTFSPDGRLLASGDAGGFIHIWNVADGRELVRFRAVVLPPEDKEVPRVTSLAFTPDGRTLIMGGMRCLKWWDVSRVGDALLRPGLLAAFYQGTAWEKGPLLTQRVDPSVSFTWYADGKPPAPGVSVKNFSAAWTGILRVAKAGRYTFTITADGDGELKIDGRPVIPLDAPLDSWKASSEVDLNAGDHDIELRVHNDVGGARCGLSWSLQDGFPDQAIPPEILFHKFAAEGALPRRYTNSLGMEFVRIPAGKSWLGGGGGKVGTREVEFKDDFYLGVYEVTQEEWQKVMESNPSYFQRNGNFKDGEDKVQGISDADLKRFPVERVSWNTAQEFIAKLNEKLKGEPGASATGGWVYRLPTVDEWEYACRGGPMTDPAESAFDFYFDKPTNTLAAEQASFAASNLNRTCKVGSYLPNRLGLHDMHGNVKEWCNDARVNEKGIVLRTYLDGCYASEMNSCRAAGNWWLLPAANDHRFGLRLARVPVAGSWQPLPNKTREAPKW